MQPSNDPLAEYPDAWKPRVGTPVPDTLRRIDPARRGDARFYLDPVGRSYASVTSILSVIAKPALVNWAAKVEREAVVAAAASLYEDAPASPKMSRLGFEQSLVKRLGQEKAHRKALEEAGDIGSQVHAAAEWELRKQLGQIQEPAPVLKGGAAWAFAAWEKWRQSVELEPVYLEQRVFSVEYGYAGTVDAIGWMVTPWGRCLVVLDWKTGKAIYWEALLQIAAYRHAIREMGHADTELMPGMIVRCPKLETDPDFEAKFVPVEDMEVYFRAFLAARDLWMAQAEHEKARKEAKGPTGP